MADIESLLKEKRTFKPSPEFRKNAQWNKRTVDEFRKLGAKNPERFWAKMAKQNVSWFSPWTKVLQWKPPAAKWFVGGKLNVSYNCLDRHLVGKNAWRRNKAAIIWEGEPGDTRVLTFGALHREVCRFANALKGLGVKKGDRVALYMPMIPELAIATLACTRIGAIHSVVFGGFSAEALRDRIEDAGAHVVVTADGGYRKGSPHALKPAVDEAVAGLDIVKHVVVVRRTGEKVAWQSGRDHWWHDLVKGVSSKCAPAKLDAEHPLFILYTSGTTGKPKGILHTTGGYRHDDRQGSVRPERDRHLLVHCGYRLDYGTLLRDLRNPCQWRNEPDVRGRSDASRSRSLLGHHRTPSGEHLLHRANGDPNLHQIG